MVTLSYISSRAMISHWGVFLTEFNVAKDRGEFILAATPKMWMCNEMVALLHTYTLRAR